MTLGIDSRYIFVEKESGRSFQRPQYQLMLQMLRPGDLLYIDALDRLGRNYDKVIEEWKKITREIKANIVILENELLFDSRKFQQMGDIGKLLEDQFLSMLSFVADQERKKMKQRQAEGIAVAKTKGITLGRPKSILPKQFPSEYETWKAGKQSAKSAMNHLNMSASTFYRRVKEYENTGV